MDKKYIPISCDFYDELTLLALRKKHCAITYTNTQGVQQLITSRILDIYTKEKAEYVLLEDDLRLRLDQLITVDGKKVIHGNA